ncbi:DUF6221 family protein [Micromonospora sp. FIMYZ51]|uniref:DUF6221 family protein n=1 Tax=Micromonospora sp. FIMYZ51 TaxID=3051832 RepID=UPI00311F3B6E
MTHELVPWLAEQIDAAETRTRKLLTEAQRNDLAVKDPRLLGRYIPGWHDWPDVERVCRDRLADLDAKRRILGLVTDCGPSWQDGYTEAYRDVVRLLAAAFAGESGYRTEWGPQ